MSDAFTRRDVPSAAATVTVLSATEPVLAGVDTVAAAVEGVTTRKLAPTDDAVGYGAANLMVSGGFLTVERISKIADTANPFEPAK